MVHSVISTWRRVAGQRIRHLTPEQAKAILAAISKRGPTIFHPEIRELTGGYGSQSINTHVIRKLAARAGMIRKENG